MIVFTQLVLSGAFIGLLYALIALGFVLLYRSGRVLNLAQGELVTVGAFLIWLFVGLTAPNWWLGLIVALGLSALVGIVIQVGLFRRMIGQPEFALVMLTIGLLVLLRGCQVVIFGPEIRAFPAIFPAERVFIGAFSFDFALFWGGLLALVLIGVLSWFFLRTRVGLRLSATAESHQIAQSLGISVNQAMVVSWVLAMVFSAFAAIVFLNNKMLSFTVSDIGMRALPVALLGGVESIPGVVVAGLIVGITESLARGYIDPIIGGGMGEVLPFIIMVLVIMVRPQGLFGWKIIERV